MCRRPAAKRPTDRLSVRIRFPCAEIVMSPISSSRTAAWMVGHFQISERTSAIALSGSPPPVSDPYDVCAGDNRLVDRAPLSRLAMKVGSDECVVFGDPLRDFYIACSSAGDIDRMLRGVAEEGEDDGGVVPHTFVEQ